MIFPLRLIFLILIMVSMPLTARGLDSAPPADPSRFVLFIHAGGAASESDRKLVNTIAISLAKRGYVVRAPDDERDDVGGPGIDYFSETERPTAEDIANTVNSVSAELKGSVKVEPRRQSGKNPPGYIGVWLFK
jgi:hypothetical protein